MSNGLYLNFTKMATDRIHSHDELLHSVMMFNSQYKFNTLTNFISRIINKITYWSDYRNNKYKNTPLSQFS
jgi:hypothetical protein